MKKAIVIASLIAATLVNTSNAEAEASKAENIGVASGAITGAAVGGPVGFIVGAAFGALIGDGVERESQLDQTRQQLAEASQREIRLKQSLAMLRENLEFEMAQKTNSQWMNEGISLNLMFTTNSSGLSDIDNSTIKRLAIMMVKYPELQIKLDGYADPRGTKAHNLVLAQQRVESVKQALAYYGADTSRIIGVAHGELDGLTIKDGADAYAMARKVSVNFAEKPLTNIAQN